MTSQLFPVLEHLLFSFALPLAEYSVIHSGDASLLWFYTEWHGRVRGQFMRPVLENTGYLESSDHGETIK